VIPENKIGMAIGLKVADEIRRYLDASLEEIENRTERAILN
jgi:hypothetical protein